MEQITLIYLENNDADYRKSCNKIKKTKFHFKPILMQKNKNMNLNLKKINNENKNNI